MMIKHCQKLNKGELDYEIDDTQKFIRLDKDYPASGNKGGRFDSFSKVPFEIINHIIRNRSVIETRDFVSVFQHNLSNNGPMLTAALLNEQILKRDSDGKYMVVRML